MTLNGDEPQLVKWFVWIMQRRGCTSTEAMLGALELQRAHAELIEKTVAEPPTEQDPC